MKFHTPVEIPESRFKLNHSTPALMLGSCFTENIGDKLHYYKFSVMTNPFGVLYNPFSIKNAIEIISGKQNINEQIIHEYNQKWFSFYHDTSFSSRYKEELMQHINKTNQEAANYLKKASFLIITFGTSWVFRHIEKDMIVANCHKLPSKFFKRELLSPEEIINDYISLIEEIHKLNPDIHITFTVSPIRHWRDGAAENQLSKATLIYSIHKIIEHFPEIEYFPSYEIVMDELRDYRFYAEDMIHLNETAIDYIWERFSETYISKSAQSLMNEVEKIQKAKHHRPFNPESPEYQKFINKQIENIKQLSKKHHSIDLSDEMDYFKSQQKQNY
jgi:hypothetical protein